MKISVLNKTRIRSGFYLSIFLILISSPAFAVGSLEVKISPQGAVDAGAQWSIDSGATWHNSGDIASGLTAGDVTLQFSTITDWKTPANQTVTIADGQTAEAFGIYLKTTLVNKESLYGGGYTSMLLKTDGTIWTWGGNEYGQLGDTTMGIENSKSIPVPVLNQNGTQFTGAVSSGLGLYHGIALKSDGTVWSWGANDNYQRGDGTNQVSIPYPVQVLSGFQTPLTGVAAISVGDGHTMAIKPDGTLWGWGDNFYGQLGNGNSIVDGYWATQVINGDTSPFTDVVAVEAGKNHTLALKSDGTVWAWGSNSSGQLGDGQSCGTGNCLNPVQVINSDASPLTGVVDIAVGYAHSLALKADGTLWAWGDNSHGEVGDGTDSRRYYPVKVTESGGSDFTGVKDSVSTGEYNFSVALKSDGTVWTWGYNYYGQLGDGTNIDKWNPVQVINADTSPFLDVASVAPKNGYGHVLTKKVDGTFWSWGNNNYGQLGDGNSGGSVSGFDAGIDQINPVQVQLTGSLTVTLAPAGAVADGAQWRVDGGAWTDSGASVAGITGGFHTLEFSTVTGWRSPLTRQIVIGAPTNTTVGIYLNQSAEETVKGGSAHTTALRHDGTVWGWGQNAYGQLGDGQACGAGNCLSPVQVVNADTSPFTGVVAIDAGSHVLAIKDDATLWAWGYNNAGKLGDGTITNRTTPVQVINGDSSPFTDVVAVSTGDVHSLALKSDGTVWAWGANLDGQIGIGTIGSGSNWRNPLQVINTDGSPLTNVIAISAGASHNMVLKADGTVWTWGDNTYRQIGEGSSVSYRPNPVQVKNYDTSPLADVTSLAAGRFHSIVLKSDGTVWGWGANTTGQLGYGIINTYLTNPVQAKTGASTYFADGEAIATGNGHTLARKTDGTLWAWGYNSKGALGDGQVCSTGNCAYANQQVTYNDSSPFADAFSFAAGNGHSVAVLSNGAVWAWGYNNNGQIGDGTSGPGTDKYYPALSGGFTTHNGSLQVFIEPQASRDAGAQWQVDAGVWNDSGDIIAGIAPGDHTVTFSNVAGQTKPYDLTVGIVDGQVTVRTGTYNVEADLGISKTDGQTTAVPGTAVTYTITVSNGGPNDVTGVTVTDTFPGMLSGVNWTCTASSGSSCTSAGSGDISDSAVDLLSGGTATYTVNATIAAGATGTLVNTASVAPPGSVTDPDISNNSATDSDTLTPQADIAVAKIESADPVVAGSGTGNLIYTVTVTNNGPSDATGVIIAEDMTLPVGVTINSVIPSAGTDYSSPTPPDGTWTVGGLASGVDTTLTIWLTVGASAQTGTNSIVNTASLSTADTTDTNSANNAATVATSICADVFYRDADGDGYGDPANSLIACTQPAGYVANDSDCNDSDPRQKPGQKWYPDVDNDGYGAVSGAPVVACSQPAGTTTDKTDCNDHNSGVNPGIFEGPKSNPVCSDLLDNDCDGMIDIQDPNCQINGTMSWLLLLLGG